MGEPLPAEYSQALHKVETASDDLVIASALGVARERLGMDTAYLTTVDERAQVVNAVIGDPNRVGLITKTEFLIDDTYCRRMLRGEMPNAVPDTSSEPAVRDLAATANIGSYIGVPITLSDGRIHGTLCAASHGVTVSLGAEQTRFMTVLARVIAERLERRLGARESPPQ